MFLHKIKIGARLSLGFGLVLLLLATVSTTSLMRLSEFNQDVDNYASVHVPKLLTTGDWVETLLQTSRQMRDVLVLDDEKQIKEAIAFSRKSKALRQQLHDKLKAMLGGDEEKALFQAIVDARAKYSPQEDEFLTTADRGDYSTAKDIMLERVRPAQLKYIEALDRFNQYQNEEVAQEAKAAHASYANARLVIIALSVLAALFGVGAALLIIRSITRPLNEAVAVARRVADGDLTSVVAVRSKDETGMLLQSLKDMNDSLKRIVGNVRSGTDAIASASQQIASGNTDLSQRTEEQASSLEETASSMEEFTGTVKQNADNARQANQLASSASEVAVKGGQVVSQVVGTMSAINDSSKKIVDIIGVIDGIAFQTNILALNAAVEAARAGEQGRGFAVVASEVRSLAQRSAAAAKEIKALIGDSVDKVDAGSRLVDQAGKTMEEIVGSVKRVTDIMAEITAASQEQSSGIEQVNQAITQMDEATQQNSALVEEASAAAQSMREQAQQLAQAVAVFKLDDAAAAAAAEAPDASKAQAPARPPVERRSPNRASNIARLPQKPVKAKPEEPQVKAVAAGGGEDQWEEF